MKHLILHESEAFTVLDCRNNKNISLKDMALNTTDLFHANDWNWASSETGIIRTSKRLSEFKNIFRFVVLLNDRVGRGSGCISEAKEQNLWTASPNHVNIIMTNNISSIKNHVPLTPWMVLHRAMHCVQAHMPEKGPVDFCKGFDDVYIAAGGKVDKLNTHWDNYNPSQFIELILTTKCARNKTINNEYDITAELFSQHYMGGVKFLKTKDWEERCAESNPAFFKNRPTYEWEGKFSEADPTFNPAPRIWRPIHTMASNPVETDLMLTKLENRVSEDISKMTASLIGKTLMF